MSRFITVFMGIKRFYKLEPEKEHAVTLDHIVAATAAFLGGRPMPASGQSLFLLLAPFSLGQPHCAGGSFSRSSGSSSGFWSLAFHGVTGERRSVSRPSTTSLRIRRIHRALFLSYLYEKMPSIHPNTAGLESPPNSGSLSEQSEESLSLLHLHNRVAPRNDNLPNRFVLGYLSARIPISPSNFYYGEVYSYCYNKKQTNYHSKGDPCQIGAPG